MPTVLYGAALTDHVSVHQLQEWEGMHTASDLIMISAPQFKRGLQGACKFGV